LTTRKRALSSLSEFFPETIEIVRMVSLSELDSVIEGVVLKRPSARYGFGWIKAKRKETHDLIVSRMLPNGVAEASTGGKVVGVPDWVKPGDLIEVEAFKKFASGKLRNGRFVRVRTDKTTESSC
jgi:ATP-dependent DNA ligase